MVMRLTSHAAAHPEQADLIGRARITDWTARIGNANPSPATPQPRVTDLYTAPLGPNALDSTTARGPITNATPRGEGELAVTGQALREHVAHLASSRTPPYSRPSCSPA